MFLDDALQDRRIALAVPRAFWIDNGYRTALTNAEAVGFAPQDAALLRQPELLQTPLEKLPCGKAAVSFTTFRRRLIAAEKDVSTRH